MINWVKYLETSGEKKLNFIWPHCVSKTSFFNDIRPNGACHLNSDIISLKNPIM